MNKFRYFLCSICLVVFSVSISAQEQESQTDTSYERQLNVREFINLKVYSGIEVKLIPANENKLLIKITGFDMFEGSWFFFVATSEWHKEAISKSSI